MASAQSGLDFSGEDWAHAHRVFDGCWVIATRHAAGRNPAFQVNNRTFVFRLHDKTARDGAGADVLLAFGCGDQPAIDAVKKLETETGLKLAWVIGNGGGHHMFLGFWFATFPAARILIPAKRVPLTRNGIELAEQYADRWELMHGPKPPQLAEAFGDQVDAVIFDQLFSYTDEFAATLGAPKNHTTPEKHVGGFKLLKTMGPLMSNFDSPNDEVFFFHKASGLTIAGHNFQFIYVPKGHKAPPKFKLNAGGFPMNLMMALTSPKGSFKSGLEGQAAPIADPAVHAASWRAVLDWDIKAWTSMHDPPTVSGPDMDGESIKQAVRESLKRSGEDDPTGARLKWTKKHGRHTP
jgi:hypothetical protein